MMERKNGRNHGEVFTSIRVVEYILDEVEYVASKDLRNTSILEPSSGKGIFALEIINRLFLSSQHFGFPFLNALISNLRFVELNHTSFELLQSNIDCFVSKLIPLTAKIAPEICSNTDFLRLSALQKYDCIVGNPPYIRHELISLEDKRFYKIKFGTFKDRADLYIGFYEHSLAMLRPNGKMCFICSNRWLYNQYGKSLREVISKRYNLKKILNIEKSSPFDEAVIAYPCITTIENSVNEGKALYCEINSKEVDFDHLKFDTINSPYDSSWQNVFLKYDINHHSLYGILEQGFQIGIGVATGADEVFILKENDKHLVESNRLLPLLTSRDLSGDQIKWSGKFVINPYENNTLCNLDMYPNLKTYLLHHRELLQKRHTAQKAPDKWYKTIDKIKPELILEPKILLPDLTGNTVLLIDEGNYYPHHNLYYITGRTIAELKILACILMSSFVKNQMSQIGIRMNGGLPRFQAQVLKKIKIPHIDLISLKDQKLLLHSYDQKQFKTVDIVINKYCLQIGSIQSDNINSYDPSDSRVPTFLFA